MWLVLDHCYECHGEPVALLEREKDAQSLCHKYSWLDYFEVATGELIDFGYPSDYEEWFNRRADRILQERSHDCD